MVVSRTATQTMAMFHRRQGGGGGGGLCFELSPEDNLIREQDAR